MLTKEEVELLVARLESFGAGVWEIRSIRQALATAEVFCYAKPHADVFPLCVTKEEAVGCMKSVLEGLRGWQGDTAKECKKEVRNWIRRASRTTIAKSTMDC
ncbi:hypothetical protein AWB73_00111 [Caballeronia turbans]|nr:hypothetical protein AWB73_00111 [Caballeronia turbans]